MGKREELKIFRKPSIEYLKKMYSKSMSYIFDKNSWMSRAPETYGESKILLHTRKSIKRLGNELKIFKAPSIVGIKIIYYKSMAFVFTPPKNNRDKPTNEEIIAKLESS